MFTTPESGGNLSALTLVENGSLSQKTHHLGRLISLDNLTEFLDGSKPEFS
ncbi:hypothetical protein IQ235_07895 [Oscillatoriales cyanobacterium LEGE 11467]|uniref:Uncharacterized protein n=1 Tax=Zarconia navalis LEGE 11467 TaxID=1828826 RepID=A0A928VZU4_9CYAN|nr:hypothetical protein [Zarconia navalis]MBE9040700.1 hypothetical protein [Zarconia navalis LEGE 11467]